MSSKFIISDTHFDHGNIIKYCRRPFSCADEMNEKMIAAWNAVVGPDDIVWHLGDFMMGDRLSRLIWLRSRLNGRIFLCRGNHDYLADSDYIEAGFEEVHPGFAEDYCSGQRCVMSHYQMTSWNESHFGSFHFYGHEHAKQSAAPPDHGYFLAHGWSERKYNVCVDLNGFRPLPMPELISKLSKRPCNGPRERGR